jgi:hypothetical protein
MRLETRHVLTVVDALLLVAILVAGLVALLTLIDAVASPSLTDLPAEARVEAPVGPVDELGPALPSGVSLDRADAFVTADVGLVHRLAWWLVGPAGAIMAVAAAEIVRKIVATARTGDPLVTANVRRLRILAAIALGYFVMGAARAWVASTIQGDLGMSEVGAPIPSAPIVVAVALVGLAQIWQRGVELHNTPPPAVTAHLDGVGTPHE